MRKDLQDFSDSSSLALFREDSKQKPKVLGPQKTQIQISMEMLIGELSEIKLENGISQLQALQGDDMGQFNLLENCSNTIEEEESAQQHSQILEELVEAPNAVVEAESDSLISLAADSKSKLPTLENLASIPDSQQAHQSGIEVLSVISQQNRKKSEEVTVAPAIEIPKDVTLPLKKEETEEEAQARKENMFNQALMSVTMQSLSAPFAIFKAAKQNEVKPFGEQSKNIAKGSTENEL